MKSFVVFALLVAAAVAAPPAQYAGYEKDAVVQHSESDNTGLGNYKTSYETSNGIKSIEEAELKPVGNEGEAALNVRGSYSYPGPDGVVYTVNYFADENGFHAEGAHIPK